MEPLSPTGSTGSSLARGGNTSLPRITASKYWIFTWNNFPGSKAPSFLELLDEKCDMYMYQHEVGKEKKTPHYQGVIGLKKKGRPISIFGEISTAIRWKKCLDVPASIRYCSKEDTRVDGPWYKGCDIPDPLIPKKPRRGLKEEDLLDWHKELIEICESETDFRTIHVYIGLVGLEGKSAIGRYLVHKYDALMVCGDAKDMKCAIALRLENCPDREPRICILNIPRARGLKPISWEGLEEIKDATFASSKYKSGMVDLNEPVHLFVFTNHEIPEEVFSEDRVITHYL